MGRCSRQTAQNRVSPAVARYQNRQGDRGDGEDYRQPRGDLGKNADGAARAEGSLRSLPAKSAGEIGARAWLQKDNADDDETNDDVNNGKQINHYGSLSLRDTSIYELCLWF